MACTDLEVVEQGRVLYGRHPTKRVVCPGCGVTVHVPDVGYLTRGKTLLCCPGCHGRDLDAEERKANRLTRSRIRWLARQQGYYIAGPAYAARTGLYAKVSVWGFREEDRQIVLCTFSADRDCPQGYCDFPPVSGNVFVAGGVKVNQLGLGLDWE